ncbi:SufBD protein [Anaerotignum sp.]|uniref:SufBD protein n=1 Tax=Anaerotignum sp. TaxID=2039241 RepID=UPI00289D8027|nr:SufBD protein [Anaerotignum sp.]
MTNIQEYLENLENGDNKKAYQCMKKLERESAISPHVYPFFHIFVEMLSNTNSYIRVRALILISANAKWDHDNKIDEIIDSYLKHITDEKPITARQCIKVLPSIAKYKPDLKNLIENALYKADLTKYKESMRPLVEKDIQKALFDIRNSKTENTMKS